MTDGERDLSRLLATLAPRLYEERYTFEVADKPALSADVFALIREKEAVTAVRVTPCGEWARISLGVHSSLEAVGLTAALSNALAAKGISANVVAGLNHDHIFVPWDFRIDALQAIRALA